MKAVERSGGVASSAPTEAAGPSAAGRSTLTQDLGSGAGPPMFASSPVWEDLTGAPAGELGGLKPKSGTDHDIGGRTPGEAVGDVTRPIGTAIGNVVGSIAGAVTGVSVSSVTTTPAAWNNHGHFVWDIGFNTTGQNGWLVQEIASTRRAENTAGVAFPDGLTRRYWEAWAVDGTGAVTPALGATNDMWQRRGWGNGSQGHWSITGTVYFTTTDPATMGFAAGNVPEAGALLSTTGAPGGLGIARLHRYAQGTWDSTTAVPTHTGSAGP